MSSNSSHAYARHLMPSGNGYPFYIPEPNKKLPPEYRRNGISIGDVGVINARGGFDFLFNITRPADDLVHLNLVPLKFEPVKVHDHDIYEIDDIYPPGAFIGSSSFQKHSISIGASSEATPELPSGVSASVTFTSSSREGGLLYLPTGANSQDLLNTSLFLDYAFKNAAAWYQFARGARGWDISTDSLYLITGCDKTDSWALATFSNAAGGASISITLNMKIAEGHASYSYEWENRHTVQGRVSSNPAAFKNQCVFARGYRISIKENDPPSPVRVSVTYEEKFKPTSKSMGSSSRSGGTLSRFLGWLPSNRVNGSQGGNPSNRMAPSGHGSTTGTTVTIEPPTRTSPFNHPLMAINRYLLETNPDALVAVTHDDDYRTILGIDDHQFLGCEDLLRRILNQFDVGFAPGCVYLSPRPQASRPRSIQLLGENAGRSCVARSKEFVEHTRDEVMYNPSAPNLKSMTRSSDELILDSGSELSGGVVSLSFPVSGTQGLGSHSQPRAEIPVNDYERSGALTRSPSTAFSFDSATRVRPRSLSIGRSYSPPASTNMLEVDAFSGSFGLPTAVAWLSECPNEILENIGLELCLIEPFSPPRDLLHLSATCWRLRAVLWNSHSLRSKVYKAVFDYRAASRRLGHLCELPSNLSHQLQKRYRVLAKIRQGNIYDSEVEDIFWAAFIMLTENDGKNVIHLENAGLPGLMDCFIRKRLYEGSGENDGWPVDNTVNSLALWIMSMMMTPERLYAETRQERFEILNLVLPFVAVGLRYATSYAPGYYFNLPLSSEAPGCTFPDSTETPHGAYPIYHDAHDLSSIFHSGRSLTMCRPLITLAAKHLYFARCEVTPASCPPHIPVTRTAIEPGRLYYGPTQEDIAEFNAYKGAKLYDQGQWNWSGHSSDGQPAFDAFQSARRDSQMPSAKWDYDWERVVSCYDPWYVLPFTAPVFPVGALNGLWGGRMIIPALQAYDRLRADPTRPVDFSDASLGMTSAPIYMRLTEHHCINPERPVPCGRAGDHFGDNLFNAWLPDVPVHHGNGEIIFPGQNGRSHRYETYVPGKHNSHDEWKCTTCARRRENVRMAASAWMDASSRMGASSLDEDVEFDDVNPKVDPELEVPPDYDLEEIEDVWSRECDGVEDIIVTGTTDPHHGQAWGPYMYYGRIRRWDGLIAILRVATVNHRNRSDGGQVFMGYLVGGTNIIGTWRSNAGIVGAPSWEGSFTMRKIPE